MRKYFLCLGVVCALFVYGKCAAFDPLAVLSIGPYVQDVQADGFTVLCETTQPEHVTLTVPGQTVSSEGKQHRLRVHGLTPQSRVKYQLRVDGSIEGEGTVTLPDATRPLTFVVYGDTRDNEVGSALVTLARSLAPELILHTGDMVHLGGDVKYWHAFFRDEGPLLADVPLYPAIGNHELGRDPAGLQFRSFFALPEHDPQHLYYAFSFGPARFIVLDGNRPDATQTRWLAHELGAAEDKGVAHVFVLLHQPPFSLGAHCGDALAQVDWVELFERYRVRAVFAGHDHAYERLERNGVRYFVSGGGGAELYPEIACAPFDRAARRVYLPMHHLLRVRVSGPNVSFDALPLDGGAPIESIHAVAGEPMFATDAPRLRPKETATPWRLAGGGIAVLLGGLWLRRRRRRTR
jgi:hypothetical protein